MPLPSRGRPRIGEEEASVSLDQKKLRFLRTTPARGPLSWPEWTESPERARLRSPLPRGFSRSAVATGLGAKRRSSEGPAKFIHAIAKINLRSGLRGTTHRSTFPGTPLGLAPGGDRTGESGTTKVEPTVAGTGTPSRRETGSSGTVGETKGDPSGSSFASKTSESSDSPEDLRIFRDEPSGSSNPAFEPGARSSDGASVIFGSCG